MVKKYILLKLICIVVLVTIAPFVAIAQVDPGIDPDLGFSYISPRFLTKGLPTETLIPIGPAFTSYSISPALSAGLSFNASTGNITGTPTDMTGVITYTIVGTGGGSSSLTANLVITVNDKAPPTTLQYNTPNIFTRNFAISSLSPTFTGDGGDVTNFSIEPSLPAGLSIDATTGVISGTPTVLSSVTDYTVIAGNTGGYTLATVRITVIELIPTISYNSPNVFTKGTAISSLSPTNTGGLVVSYRISTSLPAGLIFNTSTGVISGTPTALTATTTYSVIATNTGGSDTADLDITVNDVPPNSLSYPTPNIFYNTVIIGNLNPTYSGGAVVSFSISPSLSAGLNFNISTGVISGTPTIAYPITDYTVTATNTGGSTVAHVFITVSETAPYNLRYTSPNIYTINYIITPLVPTWSGGQVTNFSIAPDLSAGLTISSTTGNISGTPTALSDATIYTVTATNSAGAGTATVSIKVEGLGAINNQPSATDKQYCLKTIADLLIVTATGSNLSYQWYYNSTNSTVGATLISGATLTSYLPPTVTAGNKYYFSRITSPNGYDMNSNFSGNITVNPLPTISISTGNSTICVNGTTTLNNTTDPLVAFSSPWTSMNTAIATVNSSGLVTGVSAGSVKFLYTVIDANGCQNSDTTLVTVNPLPIVTPISGTTTICRGDSAMLASSISVLNNTGVWDSDNIAVASVDSKTGKVKGITGGTARIIFTVTNSVTGCNSTISTTVTIQDPITINTPPSAAGQTVCKNSSVTALTVAATASGTTIAGYQWYRNTTNSTVGGTVITAATSSSYTPTIATAGSTYYYVKVTTTSGCIKFSEVSGAILVRELPTTLIAASPQNLCSATYPTPTIYNLTYGPLTGDNTVSWYTASTGGSSLATTTALNSSTYYVAQSDGTCESIRASVVVNVVTTPAAPTVTNAQSFCSASNATIASLSATVVSPNTLKWYSSSSLGTAISSTAPLTTGTTYYATQTTSTSCESGTASVTVTINLTPSTPTASTQNLCASTIPTVANLVATVDVGNTANWYTVAIAGSALSNTTTIVNSGVYYVSQISAGNCESGRILVNVIAGPTTPLMSAGVCVGNTIAANLVDRNASSLSWYKNGSLLSNVNTFSDTL